MRYSISCRKKLSDIPSPNFWLHLSWKIRWTLYGRYTVKYVSASTTWNLVTLRVGVNDMEFGHNWGSGWHFLWWFSQKFHSSVIWTQRLCVFHFNATFSLITSSTDPVLKNLRFGESQIHRSRDHQQVEKPAIRWVPNSSFQGPPRVPNGSEAMDCFSLLWKKIQPVGSVFFFSKLFFCFDLHSSSPGSFWLLPPC